MKQNNTATGGVTFSGLLLIAFIILRLTNVITWSWVWVLAPLWVPIVLFIIAFAVIMRLNK